MKNHVARKPQNLAGDYPPSGLENREIRPTKPEWLYGFWYQQLPPRLGHLPGLRSWSISSQITMFSTFCLMCMLVPAVKKCLYCSHSLKEFQSTLKKQNCLEEQTQKFWAENRLRICLVGHDTSNVLGFLRSDPQELAQKTSLALRKKEELTRKKKVHFTLRV